MDKYFGTVELNLAVVAGTSSLLGEIGKNLSCLENLPHSFDSWKERIVKPETSFTLGLNVPC